MNPVVFFRIALLLPLVLPLALLPFGMNSVVGVLALSLAFGGAQYVVFASVLFLWIGRVKDTERIRRLSYVAPLLFIPVQAAGWVIYGYVEKLSNPELVGTWEPLIAFAVYILLIGYAYVGAVNLLYLVIFRRAARAIEPWRWFGPSACGVRPHSFHVGPLSGKPGVVRRMHRYSPTESASVRKRRIRLRHVATGTDLVAWSVHVSSRLRSWIT